jgi:hypothetical protein
LPTTGTPMEDGLLSLASHVFLQTSDAPECLEARERLLGIVRLQYLLLVLAFVRAAHYWTRVHPKIQFEDDSEQLLATHEALTGCIIEDPEGSTDKAAQSILDDLPQHGRKRARLPSMRGLAEGFYVRRGLFHAAEGSDGRVVRPGRFGMGLTSQGRCTMRPGQNPYPV